MLIYRHDGIYHKVEECNLKKMLVILFEVRDDPRLAIVGEAGRASKVRANDPQSRLFT